MASLTIADLPLQRELDSRALNRIAGGGGAPWVFGWIQPYVDPDSLRGSAPVVNFFQTNNFFQADQMNNQLQVIDVKNSASNATFNIAPTQAASNAQLALSTLSALHF